MSKQFETTPSSSDIKNDAIISHREFIPWLFLAISSVYLLAGYVLLDKKPNLAIGLDVTAMAALALLSHYDIAMLKRTERVTGTKTLGLLVYSVIGLVLPTVYLGARAFYTGTPVTKAYPLLISATAFMVIPVVLSIFNSLNLIR